MSLVHKSRDRTVRSVTNSDDMVMDMTIVSVTHIMASLFVVLT